MDDVRSSRREQNDLICSFSLARLLQVHTLKINRCETVTMKTTIFTNQILLNLMLLFETKTNASKINVVIQNQIVYYGESN